MSAALPSHSPSIAARSDAQTWLPHSCTHDSCDTVPLDVYVGLPTASNVNAFIHIRHGIARQQIHHMADLAVSIEM